MTVFEVPAHTLVEEWRPIPGTYGWYEASNLGRIRSWVRPGARGAFGRPGARPEPRLLSPSIGKRGYRVWCHRLDGKESRLTVHSAVCAAFHGPNPHPPEVRAEVRHLNGNPLDNRAENLRWGTAKENAEDRVRHGTTLRGERSPFAKLREAQVIEIRGKAAKGQTNIKELAIQYDVTTATIERIIKGETWKGVL